MLKTVILGKKRPIRATDSRKKSFNLTKDKKIKFFKLIIIFTFTSQYLHIELLITEIH